MADVIGVIGTGTMGGAMVRRLIAQGFDLVIFDTSADVMDALAKEGAVPAASPRDVAERADIVLASLPSPKVSIAVAEQIEGASRAKIYIETSTIGRDTIAEIATILAPDIVVLDAPVSGGGFAIAEGRLIIFLAGPADAAVRARPVIDALSKRVFELGDVVGRGQFCKIINNGVGMAGLVAACEGLAAADRAGIDKQMMLDILNEGSGMNWATQQMLPNTLMAGVGAGPIAITQKDTGLYLAEAASIGAATPVAASLYDHLQTIVASGDPQRDSTSLYSYFVELADRKAKVGR